MKLADSLKPRVSMRRRRSIARTRVTLRRPTAPMRLLPDVLVIGAQRAGTSSLFTWLAGHPELARSVRKEPAYFTRNYGEPASWYRAHFGLAGRRTWNRLRGRQLLAFEATPDYLFHPLAAERAAATVPDARLVVLLRDPVDRAVSHWRHMTRLGFEQLPFDRAIAEEGERTAPDLARLAEDPLHDPRALLRYSYAARGHYAEQLERWWRWYPREGSLVLLSEEVFADPAAAFDRVLSFLGLTRWTPPGFANASWPAGAPQPERPDGAAELAATFADANRRLEALLGRTTGWRA